MSCSYEVLLYLTRPRLLLNYCIFRRNKASSKDKVVNPFEVRMMMSDMNSPAHTLLPISNNGDGSNDRQALMPDVVGYDHQGNF